MYNTINACVQHAGELYVQGFINRVTFMSLSMCVDNNHMQDVGNVIQYTAKDYNTLEHNGITELYLNSKQLSLPLTMALKNPFNG